MFNQPLLMHKMVCRGLISKDLEKLMKHLMIGTSWKMNKPLSEAMAYCNALAAQLPAVLHPNIQPFFIPLSPRFTR
jgi:hypothetical protein